jgi:hypothetical protein
MKDQEHRTDNTCNWSQHSCRPYCKLERMLLNPAVEADYAELIDLVNLAFRRSGPSTSWNIEAGIIEGQRLNESLLRRLGPKAGGIPSDTPRRSEWNSLWNCLARTPERMAFGVLGY